MIKKHPLFYEALVKVSEGFPKIPNIYDEELYPESINHLYIEESLNELSPREFDSFINLNEDYDDIIDAYELEELEALFDAIGARGGMSFLYFEELE